LSNIMRETGNQRDDHRDNQHGGNGVGMVRPVPPRPTTRVTLRQMREQASIPLGNLRHRLGSPPPP